MSTTQYIDFVNSSSSMDVKTQVPVLTVHPDKLNEHDTAGSNRSVVFGIQKQTTPIVKRGANIFAPRPRTRDKVDNESLWHNIAPTIHDLVHKQASGNTNAPEIFEVYQTSYTHKDDDHPPTLSNHLGGTPKSMLTTGKPISSRSSDEQSTSSLNPSSYTSPTNHIKPYRSPSAKTGDKTIFAKPSPPPTPIQNDLRQHRKSTTPSSSAGTDRSSPAFTEWSGLSLDERSTSSPATTPPQSPVISTRSGQAFIASGGYAPEEDTSTLSVLRSDRAQSEEMSGEFNPLHAELFGDVPKSAGVGVLSLFDEGIPVEPRDPSPARVITKRPAHDADLPWLLKGQKPGTKPKRTPRLPPSTKGETAAPTSVPICKQSSPVRGRRGSSSGSAGGLKRPASPVHRSQPIKRAKFVAAPKPYELASWASVLSSLEDLVATGKAGPGQIDRVVALVKDLTARAEVLPDKWVMEEVRIREFTSGPLKGSYEYKSRHQLLEDVVEGYAQCDTDGMVVAHAQALLGKWRVLQSRSS
ncbi:hypothetical protein C8R46DRAFT_1073686 [Mycena filopes]|nr:hypothetical protein C8R46DRAFT_1073686 [Mycena filopes]